MRKHSQTEVTEVIKTHIEASNPCSMKSVMSWATYQGYGGSKMIKAIQELKDARIITVDDESIIDLV